MHFNRTEQGSLILDCSEVTGRAPSLDEVKHEASTGLSGLDFWWT